jgi:hypothetical protein
MILMDQLQSSLKKKFHSLMCFLTTRENSSSKLLKTYKKEHREEGYQKKEQLPHHTLPKMQFPTFAGDHPKIWINKCLNYFTMYNIHESLWVSPASMHLQDNAAKWYEAYKMSHQNIT